MWHPLPPFSNNAVFCHSRQQWYWGEVDCIAIKTFVDAVVDIFLMLLLSRSFLTVWRTNLQHHFPLITIPFLITMELCRPRGRGKTKIEEVESSVGNLRISNTSSNEVSVDHAKFSHTFSLTTLWQRQFKMLYFHNRFRLPEQLE